MPLFLVYFASIACFTLSFQLFGKNHPFRRISLGNDHMKKYESYGKYFEREIDLGDDFDDNEDIYFKENDEQSKSG